MIIRIVAGTIVAWAAIAPALAHAQDAPVPKFEMGKLAEKDVDWTAQAKGSVLVTSGNSQSRNAAFGLSGSRQSGPTKVSLEASAAYGRSNVLVPRFDPANPMLLVGLDRQGETTTNQWHARGRTDRFFTANNAAYVLAQIGADQIAGKQLYGGGQIGYSRQLHKSDRHTAVAEAGYDFSYESYVQPPTGSLDAVQIHSARVFVGDQYSLTADTGFSLGLEALFNLNKEKALNVSDRSSEVAAFKDTRFIGKAGLTTKLWQSLSFAFSLTGKYDQNPTLRPLPASAKGAMLAPTFVQPFADKVDTIAEATLVFTFL